METRTFGQARLTGGVVVRALAAVPSAAGGAGSLVPTRTQRARFDANGASSLPLDCTRTHDRT